MPKAAVKKKPSKARSAAARENGKKGGRPRKPRRLETYADIPPPPSDPLARMAWAQGAACVALADVLADPDVTPKERRTEVARLAKVIGALDDKTRKHQVERLIKRDHEQKAQDAGPEMEAAPDGAPSSQPPR